MFNLKKYKFRRVYILVMLIILILLIFLYKNKSPQEDKNEEELVFFSVNAFTAVNEYAEQNKPIYDVSDIKSKRQKEKFDKNFGKELLKLLDSPLLPVSVNKMVIWRSDPIDKETYIENKLTILTSNSSAAFAYLLVPKNISFPAPLVLAMHAHGNTKYGAAETIGNKGNPELFYGKELAERGYVVFAMDASSFGERLDFSQDSVEVQEKKYAQDLFELGYSPLGITIQEDIRILDFLTSFSSIDKDNIGCIGHSFGGVRCMYLSALDERIKVTVLSNSVEKFREPIEFGGTQTWLSIVPDIAKYTGGNGMLALISPRPLMVLYSENDPIFPAEYLKLLIPPIKNIYKMLEQEKNLAIIEIPNKIHEFPKEYREQAYEFLDKHLKNN